MAKSCGAPQLGVDRFSYPFAHPHGAAAAAVRERFVREDPIGGGWRKRALRGLFAGAELT